MSATQDEQALYERHYLSLVRLALHLVDDLGCAEDVVQDVFAALRGEDLPRDPVRYLQRAVVNRARSVLRRRRVARTFLARPHSLDDAESADAGTLRLERRRALVATIAELPRRQREVDILRYYEELGVAAIAANRNRAGHRDRQRAGGPARRVCGSDVRPRVRRRLAQRHAPVLLRGVPEPGEGGRAPRPPARRVVRLHPYTLLSARGNDADGCKPTYYSGSSSSISVTSAAIGERSERVSVTCANSGCPRSASITAATPS
jgi:RNA polymerase sigma factor (sigma-70 family)